MNHYIGRKIHQLRISKGMTLQELASGIMHYSLLSKIENGQVIINEEYIPPLLEKLNFPYEKLVPYMLTGKDDDRYRHLFEYNVETNEPLDVVIVKEINRLENADLSLAFRLKVIFNNMKYYMNEYNLDKIKECFNEIHVFKPNSENELICHLIFKMFLTKYYLFTHQIHKAKEHIDYCKKYIDSIDDVDLVREYYYILFRYYSGIQKKEKIIVTLETVYNFCKDNNLLFYKCDISVALGFELLHIPGRREDGYKLFLDCIPIAKTFTNKSIVGKLYHNVGIYYSEENQKIKAIQAWEKALYYKKISNERALIVSSLIELAHIYFNVDKVKCYKYILESIELADKINNQKALYYSKYLLLKYLVDKEVDSFEKIAKECEKYYIIQKDEEMLDKLYLLVSKFYGMRKKYKKSHDYLMKTKVKQDMKWREDRFV